MSRPLAAGRLFGELRKRHGDRLVLVVSADDLRQEGIKISRRLSWERTAREFVWQMASNPALLALNGCAAVVVRFGVDGAIVYSRFKGAVESWLYYDPAAGEGGFAEELSRRDDRDRQRLHRRAGRGPGRAADSKVSGKAS